MIKNRHLELSSKLVEMGQALMKEGATDKDFNVSQTGTCLILLGNLIIDEKDVLLFGQICSMFSAKKIIESMEITNHDYTQYLKQKSNEESYEELIKRINKLRGDNGLSPIK